jgi:hypothetical protein
MQHGTQKLISATKYIISAGNIAEEYFNAYTSLQDHAERKKNFLFNHTNFHINIF